MTSPVETVKKNYEAVQDFVLTIGNLVKHLQKHEIDYGNPIYRLDRMVRIIPPSIALFLAKRKLPKIHPGRSNLDSESLNKALLQVVQKSLDILNANVRPKTMTKALAGELPDRLPPSSITIKALRTIMLLLSSVPIAAIAGELNLFLLQLPTPLAVGLTFVSSLAMNYGHYMSVMKRNRPTEKITVLYNGQEIDILIANFEEKQDRKPLILLLMALTKGDHLNLLKIKALERLNNQTSLLDSDETKIHLLRLLIMSECLSDPKKFMQLIAYTFNEEKYLKILNNPQLSGELKNELETNRNNKDNVFNVENTDPDTMSTQKQFSNIADLMNLPDLIVSFLRYMPSWKVKKAASSNDTPSAIINNPTAIQIAYNNSPYFVILHKLGIVNKKQAKRTLYTRLQEMVQQALFGEIQKESTFSASNFYTLAPIIKLFTEAQKANILNTLAVQLRNIDITGKTLRPFPTSIRDLVSMLGGTDLFANYISDVTQRIFTSRTDRPDIIIAVSDKLPGIVEKLSITDIEKIREIVKLIESEIDPLLIQYMNQNSYDNKLIDAKILAIDKILVGLGYVMTKNKNDDLCADLQKRITAVMEKLATSEKKAPIDIALQDILQNSSD